MVWIPAHQELGEHPKTKRAAKRLEVSRPTMVGHLVFLWWWAMDYAQDGDLSNYGNDEVADAAGWQGDPDVFVAALSDVGFIDSDELGQHYSLHDWDEYGGKLIERRREDAERKRKGRRIDIEETSTGNPTPSIGRHTDV